MLVKNFKHVFSIAGPLLLLTLIVFSLRSKTGLSFSLHGGFSTGSTPTPTPVSTVDVSQDAINSDARSGIGPVFTLTHVVFPTSTPDANGKHPETHGEDYATTLLEHREIFSITTANKQYFPIRFGHKESINPNIIPHPYLNDTWIITAVQHAGTIINSVWAAELVCNANFTNDVLNCIDPPQILPISSTSGPDENCSGNLGWFSFNVGPHDARVFFGPNNPFTIYGSNSMYTCFGQWIHDFRLLVDWGRENYSKEIFRAATELQRPAPYGPIEKNFFVFWDADEKIYAHYDMFPKRAFSALFYDGVMGPNLGPLAAANDEKCMSAHFPTVAKELESIHQATNSLSVTLCNRGECEPSNDNTFIFTIFQHKTFYYMHSVYEPHALLIKRTSPFEIQGVSGRPLWFSGRGKPGEWMNDRWDPMVTKKQTQMFYITSISWRDQGLKYHGYLDDVMFVAFGIEDEKTGGIDVRAGDLLVDLKLCEDIKDQSVG